MNGRLTDSLQKRNIIYANLRQRPRRVCQLLRPKIVGILAEHLQQDVQQPGEYFVSCGLFSTLTLGNSVQGCGNICFAELVELATTEVKDFPS